MWICIIGIIGAACKFIKINREQDMDELKIN